MLKSKSPPPTERLFCPTQYWWLALLAILLMSGALRLPGYNFSLPFIDQLDEPFHNLSARMIIDLGTSKSLNTHHYPPGIVMLNYLMLRLFHDTDKPPGSVVGQVRLVSVAAGIGTTLVIALLGYHALNPAAGLTAATLYAITPVFQVLARYATAEIHVAFLAMLAIWLAMVGAVYRRPAWTTWATYALMLAVLFKYHALMLAPFILLAPLINGRACMRRVLANLARFALFLAWLVLLTPALDAFAEVPATENEARKSWVRHVTTNSERPDSLSDYLSDVVYNQTLALSSVKHPSLSFGWIGMILFAWQLDRRRRLMLAGLAVGAASWLLGVSLFGKQGGHAERFLFGQITLLVMLAGAGYALWWRAAVVVLKRFSRHGRLLASVLFATVYLALNLSNVQNSIAKTLDFTYADPRNFLAEWIDVTLAPGRYLYKNEARVLNRHWGGYEGVTQFELANFESPLSQSIDSMRADNISYGILYTFQHDQLLEDDPQGFLQESTLLRRWEDQPNYRAHAVAVFRLYPIQHRNEGQLGPVHLLGHDLEQHQQQAGASVPFHLYWQAEEATDSAYVVFNHLLDAAGQIVAQSDGPPLPDPLLRRSTADWDDPDETFFSREYQLDLPAGLPPGDYELRSGFYRREGGTRLLAPDGSDSLFVTTLVISTPQEV